MKIKSKIKNLTSLPAHKLTSSRGFTLIETLIAITVLLLSITAPLHIASQALFASFYSRDEITAYYLAEEAIEYVKNARDTKFLSDVFDSSGATISDDAWLDGLKEKCVADAFNDKAGCVIDATKSFMGDAGAIKVCKISEGGCPKIHYNSTTNIWNYDAPSGPVAESKFTRIIELKPQDNNGIDNKEEALIEVTVEWQGSSGFGGAKKVFLTAVMSNWQRK